MILDTNIIVWVLRGHRGAIAFVDGLPLPERNLSVVSHLELLRGSRGRTDLEQTQHLLEEEFAEIVPVNTEVSSRAVELMEKYALSHRPGIPGMFIAATAITRGEPLATGNLKDFSYISGLAIKAFRA